MMGVSHAYSGVALGCVVTSFGMPHGATLWELAGRILDAGSAAGGTGGLLLGALVAAAFLAVFGALLPGFLIPDDWTANPPLLVVGVFILVLGGAALLPDLDHPSSTVARVLGPLTGVISTGLAHLSLTLYHATRLEGDTPDRKSGHRLITHTWPGSAGFAAVALVCQIASPIASGVVHGLVAGLLAVGVRRVLRNIPVVRAAPGMTVGTLTGTAAWHCSVAYPGWSYLFPLAVLLGAMIHREGDWCTNSGVPRRLWGIPQNSSGNRGPQRWKLHTAPRTFETGKDVELYTVRPALIGALVCSALGAVTMPDLVPALLTAGGAA